MYIYDSSMSILDSSTGYGTGLEQCYFNVTSTGWYYIKINGWNGACSASVPYKIVLQHGDSAMFTEASRYRSYNEYGFFDRVDGGGHWQSQGVAYSYGGKEAFQYYRGRIQVATTNASTPFDNWSDYSSSYVRPGRYDGEGWNYCGIDCSGFIQRCAQAAGDRYKIARLAPLNSTSGQPSEGTPNIQVAASNFGLYSTSINVNDMETGDIAYWSTHIVMLAKIDLNDAYSSRIIEAQGQPWSSGGRVVREDPFSDYRYTTKTIARLDQ